LIVMSTGQPGIQTNIPDPTHTRKLHEQHG